MKKAEVEVKVKRRADSFFLSLDLILNLPTPLADVFNIPVGSTRSR
jgi:hypothetical protein